MELKNTISPNKLTEFFYNTLAQMHARLAQAVYVFVESRETNFSKPSTILANQLKAELAKKGCSFTDDLS